jgi:hypothetical protein
MLIAPSPRRIPSRLAVGLAGRAGQSLNRVLLSSLAFVAWHLSAVLLPTGFNLPLAQIPVYLATRHCSVRSGNVAMISGSVLVASNRTGSERIRLRVLSASKHGRRAR